MSKWDQWLLKIAHIGQGISNEFVLWMLYPICRAAIMLYDRGHRLTQARGRV